MPLVIAAVVIGLVTGVLLGRRLLRHRARVWAESMLRRWREEETRAIREESAFRSSAVLRGRAYEQLAPVMAEFPFDPADARFIGTPVDFVVFDGYAEVRAGTRNSLRSIVLVDVKTGGSTLTKIQRRVRDCVNEGRCEWGLLGPGVGAGRG